MKIKNQNICTRERKCGIPTEVKDICPHMQISYYISDEYYWIPCSAFIYCKECKKEYEIENGAPE